MLKGDRLAELRRDHGMTQKDLAFKLTVSATTISSYERGKSKPDLDGISKIAEMFNVSVDYLLGKTKKKRALDLKDDERVLNRRDMIALPKPYSSSVREQMLQYGAYLNQAEQKEKSEEPPEEPTIEEHPVITKAATGDDHSQALSKKE